MEHSWYMEKLFGSCTFELNRKCRLLLICFLSSASAAAVVVVVKYCSWLWARTSYHVDSLSRDTHTTKMSFLVSDVSLRTFIRMFDERQMTLFDSSPFPALVAPSCCRHRQWRQRQSDGLSFSNWNLPWCASDCGGCGLMIIFGGRVIVDKEIFFIIIVSSRIFSSSWIENIPRHFIKIKSIFLTGYQVTAI